MDLITQPDKLYAAVLAYEPVALGIVGGAALLVLLLVSSLFKGPKNAPPLVSSTIPFVGPIFAFLQDPLKLAKYGYEKYGEIFTIKLFGYRLTFMVGPEPHQTFFKSSDEELSQQEAYDFSVPMFGPDVVYGATPEKRAEQLKLVHAVLRAEKLKSYVPLMIQEAEEFFRRWGDSGVVDLSDELSKLIILTATRCLMGPEIREHMFSEMEPLLHKVDEGVTPISFFAPYLPIKKHKIRDQARKDIAKIFDTIIQQRRANPNVKHDDVLQAFMDHTYKDGTKNTPEMVGGLMLALLFAGQHTSSITSAWTGLYMHRRKDVVEGVREEQQRVLGETGGQITADALRKMDLLHACIKEALRMTPPLIFVMRKVLKEVNCKGYTIPVGDFLFCSPALGGRVKEIFTNVDEFDPYRFLPPREEDKKVAMGWLGFGAGRHACLGEQFAFLQIKTIWTVLLRDFKFELEGPFPTPVYEALVVGPSRPSKVRYTRIHTPSAL
eukprot:tig00000350_g24320.t1